MTAARKPGFVLPVTATLTVLLGLSLAAAHWRGQPFDATTWQADTRGSGSRQAMADRLLSRRSLIGLSRTEVVELLGEPRQVEYLRDWDLVYLLGPERGIFGIDTEWLVLRLETDNRVSEARLVVD